MRGALLPGLLLAGLLLGLASCASAHVEDICINPPGPKPTDGVYNFYTLASRLGCDYRQAGAPCLAAIVAQSASTFTETSNCRGAVHFNAIYFSAAALGFTQEVSYFLAAFSQSIDFVQFKGVDSCGRTMAKKYWTPPLRGFLRTAVQYGGTNRHLGVPFVGFARNPPPLYQALDGITFPLYQSDKTYNGGSKDGCNAEFFDKDFKAYLGQCPALAPDMSDTFYEGALAQARKWAVNETTLLCNAGFTAIDPKTGSPFTGSQCARGTQHSINTNEIQQGPIPLTGTLELGEQVIHFGCTPNCTAENYTVVESSKIYASRFGGYLWNQAKRHGYATMADGRPVPELVARMGIFLHWIADRSSHWSVS